MVVLVRCLTLVQSSAYYINPVLVTSTMTWALMQPDEATLQPLELKLPLDYFKAILSQMLLAAMISFQAACPIHYHLAWRGIWVHTEKS